MGDSRRNEVRHGGGGNSQAMGRGRSSRGQGGGDRSRRAWSDREEMHFIASLKELVATGWKADNGFRSGYLFKLEESMRREFPNTDLRVSPHISSKLHTWKKFYSAVSSILERSGVGFNNHGDFKIDCDEHVWSEIIKADSGARFIRYKSWPYYADWKMVFGKDRATGNNAQDTDRANELCASGSRDSNNPGADGSPPEGEDVYDGVGLNDRVPPDEQTDSVYSNAVDSERRGARKRKRGDALDGLIDVLGKLHEDTNARLDRLSDRIGYEFDVTKARKEVFQMMGLIPGLTLSQVFIASDAILARVERLDYFMSLPEGARQPYVWHALEHYTSN
ncbi:hypothetical protein SASPL_118556 [Salvia splendens]|uniref:Myb/SANT-like domain-containing protein n=1 Tax=Salvia splendens TaxID=180675 RepID=A0A8X8XWX9_SALSN|nr:hypothetical protein SASPL_118551 [Salvia splendens]KAG6421995.1 hypothetical protein SASPL_118556 [Salvia splendens]